MTVTYNNFGFLKTPIMKNAIGVLLMLVCAGSGKCQVLNPVLNDAFVLPKGGFEATVGYAALGLSAEGEREGFFNSLDFQLGYGLSRKVSLVARYEKSWYAKQMFEETASNFLFIGPEFSLKENRISLYLPFGTQFVEGVDESYFEITPTVNFSLPLGTKVFFNPAVELGFVFCEDCTDSPFLGLNFGLGVRPHELISLFVEYGLTYATEDFGEGHFYSINGGIAFRLLPKKDAE